MRTKLVYAFPALALLYFCAGPLSLLYMALLLALILSPFYAYILKLTNQPVISALAAIGTFLGFIYIILTLLIPAFYEQLMSLTHTLQTLHIPDFIEPYIHTSLEHYNNFIDHIGAYLVNQVPEKGMAFLTFIGRFYLVIVMSFYMLKDHDKFQKLLARWLKKEQFEFCMNIKKALLINFKRLIQGQMNIILCSCVFYSVAFMLLNLPFMLGALASIGSLVPYIGTILCGSFIVMYVINCAFSWFNVGYVLCILLIGNVLESAILGPIFFGAKLKIHPLLLVFYIATFGTLFGLGGVVLSMPNAVILHTILKIIAIEITYSFNKKHSGANLQNISDKNLN